jgi:hypothetical protein
MNKNVFVARMHWALIILCKHGQWKYEPLTKQMAIDADLELFQMDHSLHHYYTKENHIPCEVKELFYQMPCLSLEHVKEFSITGRPEMSVHLSLGRRA